MKFYRIKHIIHAFVLAMAGQVLIAPAQAQQDTAGAAQSPQAIVGQLVARYPKDTIDSVAKADRALAEVKTAQELLEAQYLADETACHPKFFTNACIDKAKERRRQSIAAIRPIELEAAAFKRLARVQKRDQALAEKQTQEQAKAEERLKAQQESEQRTARQADERAREAAESDSQARRSSGPDLRVRQHEAKMKRLQEKDAAKEAQRAKNVADYEEKLRESNERQKKVLERRAKKQAETSAKPAGAAQ